MNRPLPPGDCGNRSIDSFRASRSAGAVPGFIGLERRVADSPGGTVNHNDPLMVQEDRFRVDCCSYGGLKMDKKLELTRKCLALINRIAGRAAASPSPEHVRDTLMELHDALLKSPYGDERTGNHARDLDVLHDQLDFIDSTSQELTARDVLKFALRSTWN